MDLLIVFGATLVFYSATLAPTVIWGDSAWFVLDIALGNTGFHTAKDHPLYLNLGRLFFALPGDPARNIAFESAVFGALAVTLVYRISRQLGASRVASCVGAGALCVSHAFWLHSVIPEVYSANAFFLLATLSLAIAWSRSGRWAYLIASIAVLAVGLTNHLVLLAVVPALVVFVAISRPHILLTWRSVVFAGTIAGVGVVAVLVVPSLAGAVHQIWVGPPGISEYFQLTVPLSGMVRETTYYLMYLGYQFPSPALSLMLVGTWALFRDQPRAATLLLLAIVMNAGVFIHHTAWQSAATTKFVFYIADYAVLAILCAYGAEETCRRLGRIGPRTGRIWGVAILAVCVILPPAFYATMPVVSELFGIDPVKARTLPYRDNLTYFLNPNKHGYYGARRFGEEALAAVPPSAVIFADYTPFSILRYLQLVEHVRPDVLLEFADIGDQVRVVWREEAGKRRPTYVAPLAPGYYDLSGLTGDYDSVPAGPIVEVRPRE